MTVNFTIILGVIFISIVTQMVIKAIKNIAPNKIKTPIPQLTSIVVSILLCVTAHMDIFVAFGYVLSLNPLGAVITGIIASLGAGSVYDLISQMNEYKEKLAIEKHTSTKE